MNRSDVIMVVISASAVTTVLIEFPGDECVGFSVVLDGIKNGDTVDR